MILFYLFDCRLNKMIFRVRSNVTRSFSLSRLRLTETKLGAGLRGRGFVDVQRPRAADILSNTFTALSSYYRCNSVYLFAILFLALYMPFI